MMIAPSTPPRNSSYSNELATPKTPRFAPMDEADGQVYKQKKLRMQTPSKELLRPTFHGPITPEPTPVRKRYVEDMAAGGASRVLFPVGKALGCGRTGKYRPVRTENQLTSLPEETHASTKDGWVSKSKQRQGTEIKPTAAGMWYVFRGKKVFRQFPKDDELFRTLKPKLLFGGADSSENDDILRMDEEDLTEVEE